MTFGEFADCLDGYQDRLTSQAMQQDSLNYLLGRYISIGFNSPKKYPNKPFLDREKQKMNPVTDDALKRIAIATGGKVNDGNSR